MYVDPNRNTEAGNLKWILPYCKPDLPRVAGAIVLFCVNNTMALIIPLLSGLIVDRVIVQGQVDELTRLCIMMIVFTIVRVASRYGYQMWMERFGQNSVFRLVSDEYEKLHELDFTYFNHTRTGDIMSRMTSDTDAIRHALSWVSYQVLDCVVMFIGALAMMFTIDWRLALALACVTPFIFILTRGLSTHARPLFFAIRNSLAEMNSMVEENIEGNRVVKAFVREPYETEKFDKHNDDYMQRNMDQAYNSRKYMPWLDGLGFSLQLITLGFGGFLVITGRMTLGNLVAFNSYLWMIDGPVRQSGWLINDWQRFNASCIKIRKLLTAQSRITEKPENTEKPGDSADANHASTAAATEGHAATTNTTRIAGSIDFQHVSFAFPDEPDTPVLEDVDFHVPAGAKLGILGETGAGKSTLVNLISRFYDPTEGHVLIDGVDARDWPGPPHRSPKSSARHTALASVRRGARHVPVLRHHRRQHQLRRGRTTRIRRTVHSPHGHHRRRGRLHPQHAGRLRYRGRRAWRRPFRRPKTAPEPRTRARRQSVDPHHGRYDQRRRHGNGSGNPAPSARTGRTENHRHHRTPYFIGERFRSDPRA